MAGAWGPPRGGVEEGEEEGVKGVRNEGLKRMKVF
jgi:hypothetical protein